MRFFAFAAILASLTFCLWLEVQSKQKIEARQAMIADRQKELQPLAPMVAEVERYQRSKDDLQRRIDIINQLKQAQKGPVPALKIIERLDPSSIDSIAIDDKTITINSHAEVKTDAEVVERHAANGHYVLKVKI